MAKLKDPSQELAKKVLTEVDFKDRLNGFLLRERAGALPITLYCFEEVVSFLNDRHPRLDFNELEEWVRETIGDVELAQQITEAINKGDNDQERTYSIRDLMEERLNQCRMEGYHEENVV
jgi:hypothetical protein